MEIIIKDTWSNEVREEKINEYINSLGKIIYKKCKTSKTFSVLDLDLISLDLCITYAESLVSPYIDKINYGSLSILITEKAVADVVELSKIDTDLIDCLA